MQVAVIHYSPVMQTRLFEPNWVDRTVLHSFAYPRLLWESASWHIGVFVSRAQGDDAVVGIGLVHKGRQFASFERNLDVEDVHIPDQPVPVARVQKQLGRGFADAIDADRPLSEARGKRLLDALESLAPELKQVVGKLKERIDAAIEQGASGELLGLQKDATHDPVTPENPNRSTVLPDSRSSGAWKRNTVRYGSVGCCTSLLYGPTPEPCCPPRHPARANPAVDLQTRGTACPRNR